MAHRLPLLEWHAQKYGKAQPQRGEVKAGRQPRRGLGDRTRGLLAVGPLESRGSLAVRGFVGGRAGRPGWQISAGSDASQRGAADCFGSDDDGARPDHISGRAPHRGAVDLLRGRGSSRIDLPAMSRQAGIGIGLVQSEYFPVLALAALGGYKSVAVPAPKDVAPSGFFRFDLEQAVPMLNLRWLLLDFGRRGNALDAAKERLMSANLAFNRKHQEIVFHVQSAFLALTSLQRKIAVAQSALDPARSVREAAEGQLQSGLATLPEVSLARQQEAQAACDL